MTTAAAGKRKALRRRRPKANIAGGPKTQAATPGLLRCCATVRHGRRFRTPSDAAGRTIAKVAKRAPPASHGALTNCSTLASILRVSLFAPKTGEEVSLSPAMTAISYELAGHPVRKAILSAPSQDEGSWKLLAMAMGLEPLEPRWAGALVTESYLDRSRIV